MTGQHLRPLLAFVIVAIAGGFVFANALRAQDVVDVIRNGASDVLAGTPLLHEPLYVVERGEQIEAAPQPKADSSTGTDAQPAEPEAVPSTTTTAPVITSAPTTPGASPSTGTGPGTDSGGAGKPATQAGGPTGNKGDGGPVSPKVTHHGQGVGDDSDSPAHGDGTEGDHQDHGDGHEPEGHGHGHADEGHGHGHEFEGHGDGHAGNKGDHDSDSRWARGHAKPDHEKSDHEKSDHETSDAKSDHAKSDHAKSDHAKKGHAKKDHAKKDHATKSAKRHAK